ncbi:hypothetical protein EMIHUDRAFT_248967 [Emiliania huxleyi CCMP1516]|uniref:Uncharacterized protein n=2 Tax=Emiliania huxleyi TaxID=2903 RepID=A0A0D3IBU5_EMIH1|nr:hypothetical protein EMIHUDRAFT_248967 [Emiliania huxleyi CCMP1516]EOD08730.1 hypothetical protein EMIHUDRAFT_248967 [Emiliania huxleyi CCMP1516]|eukprot:XP_005761159.1 hypothetical protein EMIHUDRAFT_248967 [Emiliania huxleyi CCMP1516]
MGQHLVYWLLVRYGLRFALSLITWQVYKWKGLSDDEVGLIAGPEIDIPTEKLRVRGGWAIYTIDSLGRKLPHMNNWAGLNAWAQAVTTTSWAAFQFDSMNSTIDVVVCLLLLRTVNFWVNVLHWLSVVRTADGYARRANKIFAATGSILGMGVTVPLCSGVLGMLFAEGRADRVAFEHALMTIVVNPAGYGDALAEVVGVLGKLRFQVYGMGETNTKSVEGMVAMFLGSTVLSLSDAWAIGGWPWLMLVGLLSTIAETWSPRAFENVFIPFFASLGCAIALALQPGLVD